MTTTTIQEIAVTQLSTTRAIADQFLPRILVHPSSKQASKVTKCNVANLSLGYCLLLRPSWRNPSLPLIIPGAQLTAYHKPTNWQITFPLSSRRHHIKFTFTTNKEPTRASCYIHNMGSKEERPGVEQFYSIECGEPERTYCRIIAIYCWPPRIQDWRVEGVKGNSVCTCLE